MRIKPIMKTFGACMATFCTALFATSCSFDPLNYMSRNACEVFNCDELFFIEDMLPLSARPAGNSGSGGETVMVMDEDEDEGGGHAH